MIALTIASILATAALAPFFAHLLILTVAALLPGARRRRAEGRPAPRFLFVIPAHDEEQGIGATVASCAAVDYDPDRFEIAVIADNCTDGTARAAREAGAVVVERQDPDRRSKGHALEHFFDRTPEGRVDPANFDAAVIIDADTVVDPGLLTAFAGALADGADWVQGYYSVRNPDASWRTRLMTYAFSLYNGVWPLGQDRLGLSCALKGNGMCFSAAGLSRFPWRAYGLVEDAEFGLMLRIAGERVRFLRGAKVFGEMVSRGEASASQRKRWEAGRRSLRGKFLGPLFRSRSIGLYRKAMYIIDLLSPPLVSLTGALILLAGFNALLILNSVGGRIASQLWPVHLGMVFVLIFYILSPVVAVGLPPRYLLALVAAPYYAVWKVLRIAGRSPETWVRTRREG